MQDRNTRIDGTARHWLIALLLVAAAAVAQETDVPVTEDAESDTRRYVVELILFTYADDVLSGGEVFPPDDPDEMLAGEDLPVARDSDIERDGENPDADAVVVFDDRTPMEDAETELGEIVLPEDIELTVLPREALTLKTEYDKLVQLDAYRPVLWAGWSQATFARDLTPVIRLRRLGRVPVSFDGTLQLYLSRFLHLVVDLSLDASRGRATVPSYGDARGGDSDLYPGRARGPVRYAIHEDRIFKNGDVRYFDHPKFGLLAKVTRVEPPAPGEERGAETLPVPGGE